MKPINYSGNRKRKEEARRKKQEEKRAQRLNKSKSSFDSQTQTSDQHNP